MLARRPSNLYLAVSGALLALSSQVSQAQTYAIEGRTDTQWNWKANDSGQLDFSISIEPNAATAARANPSADYRSILHFLYNSGDRNVTFAGNNAASTVNYTLPMQTYANSQSDGKTYGPSIYSVISTWDDQQVSDKPLINAVLQPIWLDAYDWQSGHIYIENANNGRYGFGVVPGLISIINSGFSSPEPAKPGWEQLQGGFGGPIKFQANGGKGAQINVEGKLGYDVSTAVPDVMSTSLPWRLAGAAISLTSVGGNGGQDTSFNAKKGSSGDGGDVSAVINNYEFNLGPHTALTGQAIAPFAAISAVSAGGSWGYTSVLSATKSEDFDGLFGQNGNAGQVTVELTDVSIKTSTEGSSYIIGAVAASVGGSTKTFPDKSTLAGGNVTGASGGASITLTNTVINLPFNNSIGLIATSTGDQTILPPGMQTIGGSTSHSGVGDVSISVDEKSTITVGQKNLVLASSAGDTNIGVLANASGSWARELFTGAELTSLIPSNVGDVTVSNKGNIGAYGPNAAGILAQSIGGVSISSPGAGAVGGKVLNDVEGVDDKPLPGASGGSTTAKLIGGSITVAGDGATGALLQSIGGGGGAGGNSTGLFVAVGGQGGEGGDGGALTVILANSSISATGDFARGVIGQTIGGGGGNGGFAKAFGLGVSAGIGGAGGAGGHGGDVSFTASFANVTTKGQHAKGLVFQSIGGGGGTGGASHSTNATIGFEINISVGGSGGEGGAGGKLDASFDYLSKIVTTGLDAHGVLLHTVSGGGGAGGAAGGTAYNISDFPTIPLKFNYDVSVGGSGGSSPTPGDINVINAGVIETAGAGSYGLVLQSLGGGGGHGADSAAGSNSWGDGGENPVVSMNINVGVGGSGGAAGDGGSITLTNSGTITTSGHNSIGLLAQSIGGGGGIGGTGNAFETQRWVGDNESEEGGDFSFSVGSSIADGGSGGSAGDGGVITLSIKRDGGTGFTTLGSGSSAIVAQSIGGGGGVAGDAGTQSINGNNINSQAGGAGGNGGNGGSVDVEFFGNIQTGRVVLLQYQDSDGKTQTSDPVTIGSSSHGIVAQSIGGGGGKAGNADPSAALVPELTKFISDGKILNIKDGIIYWAKKVVDDKSPDFDIDYTTTVSTGGTGGKGGDGGEVQVKITDKSDITIFGHHSYAIMAQSVGGGGGAAGSATSNSLLSADFDLKKLGSDADVGMTLSVGGSGGVGGNGGDVTVLVSNLKDNDYVVPNNPNKGNLIRTGGYASHAIFAQSVGGGGGVVHEGSILGINSIENKSTSKATLGHISDSPVVAGHGGNVFVGASDTPLTGYVYTTGDAASVIFAQSVGGGGGTASFGCTTNGKAANQYINQSPCFTDAKAIGDVKDPTTFTAGKFVNEAQKFDLSINANGGNGEEVGIYIGDSRLVTDGDRAIAIVAQSIGGGGGYISADAQNVGFISQTSLQGENIEATVGSVSVYLQGGQGGSGTAYVGTYGDGAWGVLAQSIGGGGGFFGDPSLDLAGKPKLPTVTLDYAASNAVMGFEVLVKLEDAIIRTEGKNAHGIVAQSWGGGGGIFAGSEQDTGATLVLGSKLSSAVLTNSNGGYDPITISIDSKSSVTTTGDGSIGIVAQTNGTHGMTIEISGAVTGGKTYTNKAANNRVVQGIGILMSTPDDPVLNKLTVNEGGLVTTQGGTNSGYAVVADVVTINNSGTITGSLDVSDGSTVNNLASGVLNTGAVYKVGNNSLHNYGTINIGQEATVETTNLEGRMVQYDSGRTLVTFDALGEQSHDRLIVDGTAVMGGSFETRAKSLLPGNYEFLTATDLTVTAEAVDRLLYAWDATVDSNSVTVTPTRTFRTEGLSLSPTSQNLVSYLERAWDNADRHHAELFGYKHELEAVKDYNALLEGLGGQALNSQSLQMRMLVLSNLGDSMACPTVTPNGLRLQEQSCVWARLTGDISELSGDSNNLGYHASGGGLRVGLQTALKDGWSVGASAGYGLNYLTSKNFTSNGQLFDLSVSAKRDVGQWTFGGSLGYAHGWFDNNRRLSAPDVGIASGFDHQYTSSTRQSIYGAKLRAAYTFEQENAYVRPYLDFDVAYSQTPGFNESGAGKLGLKTSGTSQWNVGISPMVEYGADLKTEDNTHVKFFVSAGATFLPNNKQSTPMRFIGAQAANGSFDSVINGPDVLGRLNLGIQVFEQSGYEVRAQYGLQAGENYWSQSVSANLVIRF